MRHSFAEVTIVRHGQSTANVAFAAAEAAGRTESGITGRDIDVPLAPLGRAEAAALGRGLAARPPIVNRPEVVVCSPYRRALQTWEIAATTADAAGLRLPAPAVDDRLGDRLMGRLELLTSTAIAERFPAEAERSRAAGMFAYRPPGGESFGDIAVRLTALLEDLDRRHSGRRMFLVAHDAVVLMTRYVIENLSFDDLAATVAEGPVVNAAITRFVHDGDRLTLAEYNTATHLSDLARPHGDPPRQGG
ncbi:histidine phosphatase family protein [Frankia sp. Mgl5]|uniref:histidine phosphatase family protein n=1 Tax=Frankia sp. Mgl5 TaxID=2933793 RepID=UPI00200ED093|nr:histidine phosphatase family protein [Frankia sp. Mgl5]MCK9926800.1 histidine phosphatase family protein [Frankia sp. Mgl5]